MQAERVRTWKHLPHMDTTLIGRSRSQKTAKKYSLFALRHHFFSIDLIVLTLLLYNEVTNITTFAILIFNKILISFKPHF